ncbi:DUF2334 domain-containing protein [Corynebacterium striatum]|uniref:DUF2334 domain-containing protein n=1 Tax=Corynebacterium striatum TaxID=43770 RepID=UPI0025506820|nr:DUF2334 domain-containing protein [Corynebacterium striatum]MDK8844499.1 DUF2334 domain-containing protein [Corynebacterium striatum]
MHGHLLVSISSIFDDTRKQASNLIKELEREEIPVSLLVAPHIDGNWHLAKDEKTLGWLKEQEEMGRVLILNGFDQTVQGRRAEFANLDSHEANLRLKGATRQMAKLGFEPTIFAPPRWRMSPGTLEVLPNFSFSAAASTRGIHELRSGKFHQSRNLSFGEGFGAAKWWRRNIIRAAERSALRGNTVRLSISGRNLHDHKVTADFLKAVERAATAGAQPVDYGVYL